jgi:RNA recognition motif-containing protein
VGGIPGHLKNSDISGYFEKFGQIQDCQIVYDQNDKDRPCGFAFMTVENFDTAEKILGQSHYLHNALVECKLALNKNQIKEKQESEMGRKIYVGGLPKNLPDKQLKQYFSQFGELDKAYVVKDYKTNKTKGFGFVIFKDNYGFEKSLACEEHQILGKEVHARAALTRAETKAETNFEIEEEESTPEKVS